jgi:Nucleotidyl transferase AbiEii toxin, Type IV TA system
LDFNVNRTPIELLQGWLRRGVQHPQAERLILRGSLLVHAWCHSTGYHRARVPADVDYLVLGDFVPADAARFAQEITLLPDETTNIRLERTEVIWENTPYPGLRAHINGQVFEGETHAFQVDFSYHDPLSQTPRVMHVPGVGPVLSAAAETMWAWKLHGLIEFGRGKWRAKDVYDLNLLWQSVPLDTNALRSAIALAFSSRDSSLNELEDFRTRESWGCSKSGQRKWRVFTSRNNLDLDFLEVRAHLRNAIDLVLPKGQA